MESNFGKRLELERKRLCQTQADFGEMGGVSRLAQWKYEHGENFPSVEYLENLRDAKADVIYLITGNRLTQQEVDWDIMKEAFIFVYQMLANKPGKNYAPEQLFDLFKHLLDTMMIENYGSTTPTADSPSRVEVTTQE